MDTSAPKRRKTSPTTNVPVRDPNAPASSSSASSVSSGTARRSARIRRPSFPSPSEASLSRANPDVLARRNAERAQAQSSNDAVPAASEAGGSGSDEGNDPPPEVAPPLEARPETGRSGDVGEGSSDNVRPPQSTPTRQKSPIRRAAGAMGSKPRRTPNKPSPRPLPPPSADEEELIDPFQGRKLRRSPPPGVLPRVEPEEPELPPTPTQRGVSDPSSAHTSPVGIHRTPSKRPRRSRVLAETMKSSPLKQPPLRPEPEAESVAKIAPSRLKGRLSRGATRPQRKKRTSHIARKIEEPDPLADKKALRDSLLSEVAQLEKDLDLAALENKRLHQLQESGRGISDASNFEDEDSLLDLLRRHALPPEKETPPDPTQEWLEAAMNPIAFLPFGMAGSAVPPLFPSQQEKERDREPSPHPVSHHPLPMTATEELPYLQVFTPLTFTSTITTLPRREFPPSPGGEDVPGGHHHHQQRHHHPLQRHVISVASAPPGLFAARIDMTVDSKTLSITHLRVPRLDPAAVAELGPFVAQITTTTTTQHQDHHHHHESDGTSAVPPRGSVSNGGGALTRHNVSVLAWAMGEWTRLATRRARFWCAVERDLGSDEGLARCAAEMRRGRQGAATGSAATTGRKKGRGRGRKAAAAAAEEEEEEVGEENERDDEDDDKAAAARFSRADMLPQLGRTSLDLTMPATPRSAKGGGADGEGEGEGGREEAPTVRIQWSIGFDWTGEGHSKIGLLVGAPAKWHGHDAKGSLAGIPDVFDKLIRENRDPMEAVRTVVALLVGDDGKR
ncbi:hypothetical protein GGR56DRAFT_389549 [Xylariaceae sp. FL0804]|nr:hypothetical protein GGR56DRAFT_389549 [Xylariaceae sp. FL0804]